MQNKVTERCAVSLGNLSRKNILVMQRALIKVNKKRIRSQESRAWVVSWFRNHEGHEVTLEVALSEASSLRLRNGYARDDAINKELKRYTEKPS